MTGVAREGSSPRERINALWALSRTRTDKSHEPIVERLLTDRRPEVRIVAARALGLSRAMPFGDPTDRACLDASLAVRREAVIALARSGAVNPRAVFEALADATREADPMLAHAVTHCLIDMNAPAATRKGLTYGSPAVNRAALIALDQMESGDLKKAELLELLLDRDRPLQRAAWQIVMKHPDWFGDVTGLIRKELQAELSDERRELLRDLLINASQSLAVELFVAEALADKSTTEAGQLLLLEVVASADGSKPPPSLVGALKSELRRREPVIVRQTIRAIRARGMLDCEDALRAVVATESLPTDIRLAALAAVVTREKELAPALLELTIARWAEDPRSAAQILGTAKLSEDELIKVADVLPRATALEIPRVLDAFRQSSSEKVGLALVEQLSRAPALAAVAPTELRAAFATYPANVRTEAEPLFRRLAIDESAQRQKLTELAGVSEKGDKERGRQVFFSRKALCAACHAVKGEGERIGPDLSKIGGLRTEADLLESIVFPSSSIARGYESVTVTTKDGHIQSGMIRRETAEAIYLVTTERNERRYAKANIESLEPSRTSIMPQGLDAQMSRQELGDLIAFLRSLK
jgi:putative heme-binding domain-containing protein